jgi:hypothetical protein
MNPRDSQLTTADVAAGAREAARDPARPAPETPPGREPLLVPEELDDLRERWSRIQTAFVDEPRRSVEDADRLVAETIKRLAESFAAERADLEGQWGRGDQVSTEDLRQLLRRYRSFFDRLLSM